VVIGDKVGNGRCKEVDEMDEMDAMEESLRRSEEETMRRVEKEREKGKCGIDVSDDFGVVGEALNKICEGINSDNKFEVNITKTFFFAALT
jgi:hypothetical protein